MSTSATYIVTGMTCDHCVLAVTSEISAIEGVSDVQADLISGEVTVTSAVTLNPEEVRAAVDEAGYELAGIA